MNCGSWKRRAEPVSHREMMSMLQWWMGLAAIQERGRGKQGGLKLEWHPRMRCVQLEGPGVYCTVS